MKNTSLNFAKMGNVCLKGAKLDSTSFFGANLSNADQTGIKPTNTAKWTKANLSGVKGYKPNPYHRFKPVP